MIGDGIPGTSSMVVEVLGMLLLIQVSACTGMDMVRLTSATCSPKASVEDVAVLNQSPDPPMFVAWTFTCRIRR